MDTLYMRTVSSTTMILHHVTKHATIELLYSWFAKCTIFCEPGNRTKSRTAAGYSSWDNQYRGAFPPPLNNMSPQIIILYRSLWSITCSSSSHQVLWYILVPGMTSFIHWLHIKSTDTRKWRTHSMTELLYRRDRITVFTCISLSN